MDKVEVVRKTELGKGEQTRGILRDKAFEKKDIVFSRSKIYAGTRSKWHHHGERDLYGFMVSGRLQLDCRNDGIETTVLEAGDFFHIPVGVVHRDVNPEADQEAVVVTMLLGGGPAVVNIQNPD